jgi:pyruvate,water dikinase
MAGSFVSALSDPDTCDPGRFGPKAANLAKLHQAGLPTPGGCGIAGDAYREQVAALGLEATARAVFATDGPKARRHALDMKLGLMEGEIISPVREELRGAWHALEQWAGERGVVRSSALVEDREGSSFAGQFESFLELEGEEEFFTAVRSCWAALWSTRALRYMATHGLDPADTAMALLVQPLVRARTSGGGMSRAAEDEMWITAAPGLGAAIAQGEVVPDRYVLGRDGRWREAALGRKYRSVGCAHGAARLSRSLFAAPCLAKDQVIELGGMISRVEELLGMPVEIEWSLDAQGFKLLQARPLHIGPAQVPDEIWLRRPRLVGHPAGVGWGTGRAVVVNCECELERVAPGDVLVTTVAGPGLAQVLARVAGVVAELGGSTSHLASLARERGVPMVLGVQDATLRIPDGSMVAVDGVAGIVRWMQ